MSNRISLRLLYFFIFIFVLSSCERKTLIDHSDLVKLAKEEPGSTLFYKYFDKINPRNWMNEVIHEPDSVFRQITRLDNQLSEPDSLSLAALGSEQFYLNNFTARKVFVMDSLPESDEPVYPFVIPIGKTKEGLAVTAYTLQDPNEENCNLYFAIPGKIIASISTSHENGLVYDAFTDKDSNLIFCCRYDFGSGSGSKWDQYFLYIINEKEMSPLVQLPAEVEYAVPLGLSRYKNYETLLSDTPELKFTIKIKSQLVYGNNEYPLLDVSVFYDSKKNLKDERIPALYNDYFTSNTEKLFLHAFRKQLLKQYVEAQPDVRRWMRTYFHQTLFNMPL